MGLIKSYGNYVIRQQHQLTNNGTIFERDYSTVGGIGEGFKDNLTYRQGTFVFGINNETPTTKQYNSDNWVQSEEGDIWTQENINTTTLRQNSLEIILKPDTYKLKDFAYYGSCAELIRTSIVDIINNFPGELYILEDNVLTYEDGNGNLIDVTLANSSVLFVIDNPFNLDIHTCSQLLSIEEQDNLKFILSNFDKYVIIDGEGDLHEITNIEYNPISGNCISDFFCFIKCEYKKDDNTHTFEIYGYKDDKGDIFYLSPKKYASFHIRPKQEYFDNFIFNLDAFQKILLNVDSKPQYSAIFEVMEETDYGYKIFYKKFIFPNAEGEYNLDIVSDEYKKYINSLFYYATIYDEIYCNNLYRHMTHESIKNFDWTDVLKRGEETKEEYIENGQKISKMLAVCGRELDEIKFYIDGIKNCNSITYNDANNIPDYFLTDALNVEGWDVKNIFPFKEYGSEIIQDMDLICQPYYNLNAIKYPYGYFSGYWDKDNCQQSQREATEDSENYEVDKHNILREKIKQYINDKKFSMQDVNNRFMKYLKLNSRAIFQKKGTIEAIETLLSLFGMKSKRWFNSLEPSIQSGMTYDYDIQEFVAITIPLEEMDSMDNEENLPKSTKLYDFFNSTKTFSYNTTEFYNNTYVPYQGLPVRYYDVEDKRILYPYFSSKQKFDGDFYYQMKGGWLHKNYNFSSLLTDINSKHFVDTNTQIPTVNDIKELLKIQDDLLYDGIIYYVKNIKGLYVCINNEIYDIKESTEGKYFEVPVYNGYIRLGTQEWYGEIEIYNSTPNTALTETGGVIYEEGYNTSIIDLSNYDNGDLIKIYVKGNNTICVKQDEKILINYAIFRDGVMLTLNENTSNFTTTNFFILQDKQWKGMLGFWGWKQLTTTDTQYLNIVNLKRNYNANNPHMNMFTYDNGIEYLKYYDQLFRHAIINESFNQNCYSSFKEYVISLNYIEKEVGFKNLINKTCCQETMNLYEDTKIHHFCDYYTPSKEGELSEPNYFYEFKYDENNSQDNHYNFYDTDDYNKLTTEPVFENIVSGETSCLDQIINLKNITLTIFQSVDADSIEKNTLQWKFFDEIILHYLSQILPTNIILNIEFKARNEKKDK